MNEDMRSHAHSATSVTERVRRNTPDFRLFSPDEASRLIGEAIVTSSWIREKARKREIDFTLIAGKIALTEQQLTALIEQHVVTVGSDERPATPRRRARPTVASAPTVTPLRSRPPQRLRRASGDGCG